MLGFAPDSTVANSAAFTGNALVGGESIYAAFDMVDSVSRFFAATSPFITLSTDTPPNQPFLGTLQRPIAFQRSIVGNNGFGPLSIGFGEMELNNTEADYDDFINQFGIDGRRITLSVGGADIVTGVVDAYNSFTTIAELTATGWTFSEDTLRIQVRDNSYKFATPAQPNVFAGTGGLDGGTDLAGKRLPLVLGWANNITPANLIPEELILQCSTGDTEAITTVWDQGVELTFQANFATSVLLRAPANAPAEGSYSTCLAEGGLIKLGAAPAGQVTARVKGAKLSGTWAANTADCIRYLILNACDVVTTDFDMLTFDLFEAAQSATIGYYLSPDSNESVQETIAKLTEPVGGWIGFGLTGLIELRRFEEPETSAVERYTQYDYIGPVNKDRLPGGIDPIVRRIRLTYDYNWTMQSNTDLAGSVIEFDPDRAAYLATQYRTTATSDALADEIVADHPLAIDPEPIIGYFVNESDAIIERDRRMNLYGVERSVYRFTVKDHIEAQDVGDTIFLSHIRFGLSNGAYATVVQTNDNLETNETELTVFL